MPLHLSKIAPAIRFYSSLNRLNLARRCGVTAAIGAKFEFYAFIKGFIVAEKNILNPGDADTGYVDYAPAV
ncbi:hypothetical protein GS399_20205 [Pedobacter sp. HMF7647]|uniref:Uncharacterized protein n=1 Tax=Hufsiella arboris TaxID=2695275 RepID=A0A7K1YFB6_9SPHI|nr:hypothetical protein [Hufsiella arboris]MXV53294.1 hypothetical protein [Hufsiella arboris]